MGPVMDFYSISTKARCIIMTKDFCYSYKMQDTQTSWVNSLKPIHVSQIKTHQWIFITNAWSFFLRRWKLSFVRCIHNKPSVINVSQRCFYSLTTGNIKLFEQKWWLRDSSWFAESCQHFFVELFIMQSAHVSLCQTSPILLSWLMKLNTVIAKTWSKAFRPYPEQSVSVALLWNGKLTHSSVALPGASQRSAPTFRCGCNGVAYRRVQLLYSLSQTQGATTSSSNVSRATCSYANLLVGVD